jgi:hypothetical protein
MVTQEDVVGNGGASKGGKGRRGRRWGGGEVQGMTKSLHLLRPLINIQESTDNSDYGGWEMEGCAKEVRGLGEDGKEGGGARQ